MSLLFLQEFISWRGFEQCQNLAHYFLYSSAYITSHSIKNLMLSTGEIAIIANIYSLFNFVKLRFCAAKFTPHHWDP